MICFSKTGRLTWRNTWVWIFLFTYKKVVNKPIPTASPTRKTADLLVEVWTQTPVHNLKCVQHGVRTQGVLNNKLSTEDDYERKTFLNPAKKVTEFREGGARLSWLQVGIDRFVFRFVVRMGAAVSMGMRVTVRTCTGSSGCRSPAGSCR